jgi:uncharacterized RDD family membrane protein YckC
MPDPSRAAQPAALHWRLLALVYDLLPLAAIWFAVAALLLLLRGGIPVAPGGAASWFAFASMLLAGFAYFGLSWRRGGQTLGMRAWRLRLLDAHGRVPGWPSLVLRYLVAGIALAAFGLGYWWAWFDPQRRTWHDLASGTRVLRLPR